MPHRLLGEIQKETNYSDADGVMAGFNMGGDLREPKSNIPIGSLAAVGISWFFYIIFVFLLGAICTRESLRYDFMIAEKVSLVGFLFLLGLYISSLASCMGGLYAAPRILQCIAQEKVVPALAFLGHGRGRNRTPVAAICLTSLVTMAFIFMGQVNVLAPIVTVNFMLTYIAIDYSYFSLSMSPCNPNQKLELGRRKSSRDPCCSEHLMLDKGPGYGSEGPFQASPEGTLLEFTKDLDQLFHLTRFSQNGPGKGEREGIKEKKKVKHPKVTKHTLQESFLLDLNSPASPSFPTYSRVVTASSAEAEEHRFTQQSSSSQPKGDHEDQLLGESQQLLGPDRQASFPGEDMEQEK